MEDEPDLALGLPHVLVQQLRTLDVEEVTRDPGVASPLADLLGKRVRHGLRDQGLPAAWRSVKKDSLRRLQAILREELPMQVRELDGVGDGLDLAVEPTDVGVGDVRHLFEHDLFELGPRQLLIEQHRARVQQQRVARAQLDAGEILGNLGHLLFVGAPDDQHPAAVLQHFEHRDDLTAQLRVSGEHDVQRLVQDDLLSLAELVGFETGMNRDPHLAPAREDVDGPVVIPVQVRAVRGRRLGELVHLFPQGGDVLLGLLEREGQLLVLRHRMCKLALGLEQPLFERAHASGRLLKSAPELGDLVLSLLCPAVQFLSFFIVCWEPGVSLAFHRRHHLLTRRDLRPRRDPTPASRAFDTTGAARYVAPRESAGTLSFRRDEAVVVTRCGQQAASLPRR